MKYRLFQWLGFTLILIIGTIHLLMAPVEFEETRYVGALFGVNFLGSIFAASGILRNRAWGWATGLLISAGALVGYILSRTVGLPGHAIEEWFFPYGIVSIIAESLFILVILTKPWRLTKSNDLISLRGALQYLIPAAVVLIGTVVLVSTYVWDANTAEMDHGHVETLDDLLAKPVISMSDLEKQYGIRVTQAGMSALNSFVDVRVKVIDPEKSYPLLNEHFVLLVDQKAVVLAPHMHSLHAVKQGKIFVMFFPSQNNTIHAGSKVSLVIGDLLVEPVMVY